MASGGDVSAGQVVKGERPVFGRMWQTPFADRVRQGLTREAHQLLGGDMLMAGDQPWKPEVITEAKRRGLAVAQSTNFISMAQSVSGAEPKSLLTGAKAVTESYPLRGKLRIAPRLNAPDAIAASGPGPGTVWLDERLTSALAADAGSKVRLGNAEFTVAAVLTLEPDRGANFFNIAPRLMMNAADVASTGLIQTGSRVTYQVLVAGERKAARAGLLEGVALEDDARAERARGLDLH